MAENDMPAAPPRDGAPPTKKLHDDAMEAEKRLESLATGLGQIGADPAAVKAVSQMADVLRRIAKSLAPAVERDDEPEPEQPETIDSATESMMAEARARRQQA